MRSIFFQTFLEFFNCRETANKSIKHITHKLLSALFLVVYNNECFINSYKP